MLFICRVLLNKKIVFEEKRKKFQKVTFVSFIQKRSQNQKVKDLENIKKTILLKQ